MKPYTRSIIELFDGKKRYLIPLYQRHYAWRSSPQLELLWEDIERAIERINIDRSALSPHFMGAIVVSQIKTFGKQVQAFEIIDGQQRLTTFQLLISALRDVAARNASKYAAELQKYLLNDGVMENSNTERYKVWPSLTDRRSFVSLIDPSIDLNEISSKPSDEDGIVRRSTDAHAFFVARIEEHVQSDGSGYDEGRLETLFEALKEGLAIVSIELEGGDDPQTIFETLNSRGVDLSQADLLRNFIFQRAKGLGQTSGSLNVDALYEKHWLPLDRAFWHQNASRGRQSRQRLDWMFTDHLSMHVGEIVSVETLFEKYRRWILHDRPFDTIADELHSISSTEEIEKRLFNQSKADPVGNFGRFADAFDVSTAMPLVVFLSIEPSVSNRLLEALTALESYILRRDVCGLPTKNYNRFFVGIVARLRSTADDKVDELVSYLSTRSLDLDRWPDDAEFREGCVSRDQYKGPRQPRLRYILEAIEQIKRSALTEDIEIRSPLTIEHIMPQSWRAAWPIPASDDHKPGDLNHSVVILEAAREAAINRLGNLTLLTHSLNTTVSNGPFSIKMPAVRAHSSLALNRDLNGIDKWDETAIAERSALFFNIARKRWMAPKREGATDLKRIDAAVLLAQSKIGLPPDGTQCRFSYAGTEFIGFIENGALLIEGFNDQYSSFSAASAAVTKTNRNGWMDWYLLGDGKNWVLADQWRKSCREEVVGVSVLSGDRRKPGATPSNIYSRPGSQNIVSLLNSKRSLFRIPRRRSRMAGRTAHRQGGRRSQSASC